jgi:copper chaperone CopZ
VNYPIRGMHCASCANIIEKTLKKAPGVNSVEVNFGTEKAKIEFDDKLTNLETSWLFHQLPFCRIYGHDRR